MLEEERSGLVSPVILTGSKGDGRGVWQANVLYRGMKENELGKTGFASILANLTHKIPDDHEREAES